VNRSVGISLSHNSSFVRKDEETFPKRTSQATQSHALTNSKIPSFYQPFLVNVDPLERTTGTDLPDMDAEEGFSSSSSSG
jgi:hypothetical protein